MVDWSALTESRISALANTKSNLDGFAITWPNVLWCAEQFWQAQLSGDAGRRKETWHHLVMAAGNFKRQGGSQIRLLRAVRPGHVWPNESKRPTSCTVPTLTGDVRVDLGDPVTWRLLTENKRSVRGLGVPTATTLLSALWPGAHVIIDVRDLTATVGLNLDEVVGNRWVRQLQDPVRVRASWGWYEWLQPKVIAKAHNVEPVAVERSLYELDARVKRPAKPEKLTWAQYVKAVDAILLAIP